MRWLAALCLMLIATEASATSAEKRYIALRDSTLAKFATATEESLKQMDEEAALKELENAVRAAVGPVKITLKGLPVEGRSNVEALTPASGFGHLDGLVFTSAADGWKTYVVVTTTTLLRHWLEDRQQRERGVPRQVGAALHSGNFYWWQANDSHFTKYADLPILKPRSASLAVAVLGLHSNGLVKGTPNEVNVSVIQGDRLFVATTPAKLKTDPIPACERIWRKMMARPLDKTDPRDDMRREDEAAEAFARCFTEYAPTQRWFPAANRQAQRLMDQLPLRQ